MKDYDWEVAFKPLTDISKHMERITAGFMKSFAKATEPLIELTKHPSFICYVLGEKGFYLPAEHCYPEILQSQNIGERVAQKYLEDSGKLLNEAVAGLRVVYSTEQQSYLDQAMQSYENGFYVPATICAMTLVEPLLISKGFMGQGSIKTIKSLEKLDQEALELPSSKGVFEASGAIRSAKILYAYQRFADYDDELDVLNRHSLLHGRSIRDISEADFIQTIGVMYGLSLIKWDDFDPYN